MIESLNLVYSINVGVEELKVEAEKIRGRLQETMEKYQQMKQMEKRKEIPESMYT